MDMKKEFNAKKLEPHQNLYNLKFDGVENVKADVDTIDAICEAYSLGRRVLMGISGRMLIIETTSDFLKKSYLVDVTSCANEIIKEIRKGRLSYETRMQVQDTEIALSEIPIIIFEVEKQVKWMLEDIQTLKEWMDSGKKIWRISVRNSKGILLAIAYVSDQKWFDWMKEWMDCFMSRKQTYLHHTRIQPLYKQTLVNPRAAKLFVSDLQRSGFIPVKNAQHEFKKIKQILKTASWVNKQEEVDEGKK